MPRTNPSSATASPAASSPRDLPAPGGLCAIHQPNFLPRLTMLASSCPRQPPASSAGDQLAEDGSAKIEYIKCGTGGGCRA